MGLEGEGVKRVRKREREREREQEKREKCENNNRHGPGLKQLDNCLKCPIQANIYSLECTSNLRNSIFFS